MYLLFIQKEIKKEIERRKTGKEMLEYKRRQEEELTKRMLEERNREKAEERAARERIRQQIAMVSFSFWKIACCFSLSQGPPAYYTDKFSHSVKLGKIARFSVGILWPCVVTMPAFGVGTSAFVLIMIFSIRTNIPALLPYSVSS